MKKILVTFTALLFGAILWTSSAYADSCHGGSDGYTVNGTPVPKEVYDQCVSQAYQSMSGSHAEVTVQNPAQSITIHSNQPQTVVVTVIVTATPIPTAVPVMYHPNNTYKPAVAHMSVTPVLSQTATPAPTKSIRRPKPTPRAKPKTNSVSFLGAAIKSLLHFITFGIYR